MTSLSLSSQETKTFNEVLKERTLKNFPNIQFIVNLETLQQLDEVITEQSTNIVKLIMIAIKCTYNERNLVRYRCGINLYDTIPVYQDFSLSEYHYCKSRTGVITKRDIIQCLCNHGIMFNIRFLHLINFEKKSDGQVDLEFTFLRGN